MWNRGCRSGHCCVQLDAAPGVLINNSFGEWNYTLCFFHSWLSFSCAYLLGRRNSDPHRDMLSDCGLGPELYGQCVRLLVHGAPGQKRTVPGDQGGACGPSSRATRASSSWSPPAAPAAAEPAVPMGVLPSQRVAFGG